MTAIRPIVTAAFKVDELVEQFQNVDVPDGVLVTGDMAEVNEKFDNKYLISEAENRLSMIESQMDCIDAQGHPDDWKICARDKRQLTAFIKKWSK